jgi:hypothetical protein
MPAGEAQDCQRGRHTLCYDFTWLRKLLRSLEDLSLPIPRSEFAPLLAPVTVSFVAVTLAKDVYLNYGIDWWYETLLANQNKPAGQFGAAGASGPNPGGPTNAEQHVLSGDSEMAEDSGTAFGYPVHNGNGSGEY